MWTLLNATVHITQEWMWLHIGSVYNCGMKQVFLRALVDAGIELENFVTQMKILPRHARDEHEWEDGKCGFHSLTLCSCGQCGEGDVKCERKAYKTRNVIMCPYLSLAYQIECEKRAQQAHDVIHPVLGRGHTDQNEASHNVLIRFRPKHSDDSPPLPCVH